MKTNITGNVGHEHRRRALRKRASCWIEIKYQMLPSSGNHMQFYNISVTQNDNLFGLVYNKMSI